jgi:hypothetical protein
VGLVCSPFHPPDFRFELVISSCTVRVGLDLHPVSKDSIHSNGQEEECKLYPKSRSNKLGMLAEVIPAS